MFDAFRKIFSVSKPVSGADGERDMAIAIAALLVEAAVADDHYAENERALIDRLLEKEFSVAAADVSSIRAEAERQQKEAVDLYRFIRIAKSLAPAEKVKLVESLWRIILSDNEKHSWEDMLVRRVCGLLHVDDVDSGLARQRVQKEIGN